MELSRRRSRARRRRREISGDQLTDADAERGGPGHLLEQRGQMALEHHAETRIRLGEREVERVARQHDSVDRAVEADRCAKETLMLRTVVRRRMAESHFDRG